MIEKIELKNWKNHSNITLDFQKGVNSIVGNMGSGKSSILQAITFSLFGTFSELKSRDLKINELVNRNSKKKDSSLKLYFNDLEGNKYNVLRTVSNKGAIDANLKDNKGNIFSGPQVQEVNKSIERLLKINQNLWLKTVYAKQNDIDYFLKLSPLKRKNEIDSLMGLDKFENSRKNVIKIINLLKNSADEKGKILEDFDVENLNQNIKEISNKLEELKKEKSSLKKDISEAEDKRNKVKEEVIKKKEKANEINKLKERYNFIKKEIEKITKLLDKTKVEKNRDFEKEFSILKEKISSTQIKKQKLRDEIEKDKSDYHELEKELGIINEKKVEVEKNIETRDRLKKELFLYENIEKEFDRISKELLNKRSEIDTKKGELENLKRHLGELMVTEDVCPVCSNKLEKSTKKRLISNRKQEIFEKENKVEELNKELQKLNSLESELKEKNNQRSKITNKLESFQNLEEKREVLVDKLVSYRRDKLELNEKIKDKESEFEEIEKELSELSNKHIELKEEKNIIEKVEEKEIFEKELKTLNKAIENSKDIFDELSSIEERYEEVIKKVQELQTKREYIVPLINEKGERLIDLIKNKEEINKLKESIDQVRKKIEFLKKFKNAIIAAQGELRRELILAVNEVMSNLWQELYPYDKWSSLRLLAEDQDYILQIKETNGDWLSVNGFASGGERMIASLSLRIAFSKVLAPNLDLLILDEPTHNLDKNAIDTLTQIIEEKLSNLLNQVFIVTHEEKIAESAKNLIKID